MTHLAAVAPFGFDAFDPLQFLETWRRFGCTHGQLLRNMDAVPSERQIIETCGQAQVPLDSIHGVFGPEYDPSSPDETFRRATIDIYEQEGELARRLDAPQVVAHPAGIVPEGTTVGPEETSQHARALEQSLQDLARIGERLDVVYLIENLTHYSWIGRDAVALADMLRRIDAPHLRMCFDTGHAQMTGTVNDRLAQCADVVAYLHVHDNDGQDDSHQMPGHGSLDWDEMGRVIRDKSLDVPTMIEVFYQPSEVAQCIDSGLADQIKQWLNAANNG